MRMHFLRIMLNSHAINSNLQGRRFLEGTTLLYKI